MDEPAISRDPDALQPELQAAERVLKQTLGELCSTKPEQADTGEMIRLDERLAIASEAAKKAVSLRRRLHQETGKSARTGRQPRKAAGGRKSTAIDDVINATQSAEHRTFRDSQGVTWSVWAVHPQAGLRRAGLPGTFAIGWLAFVCEQEKRRLSPVPMGWEALDDAGLERLCGEAEVARTDAAPRRGPKIDPPGPSDASAAGGAS